MSQSTVLTNWSTLAMVRPQTRAERKAFPNKISGILTTVPAPRLITRPRPFAAQGEVVTGPIRCAECGRRRNELVRTLQQFVCTRCAQ